MKKRKHGKGKQNLKMSKKLKNNLRNMVRIEKDSQNLGLDITSKKEEIENISKQIGKNEKKLM